MGGSFTPEPEDRLFDALQAVFELEQSAALDISTLAACQIASFVADVGVMRDSPRAVDNALNRIDEMRVELSGLSSHLQDFKAQKYPRWHH